MPRQLEYVVSAAGFGSLRVHMQWKIRDRKEVLSVTASANDIRAVIGHPVPEEVGNLPIIVAARLLVFACRADYLGNLRVVMQPVQPVLILREGDEQRLFIEVFGDT